MVKTVPPLLDHTLWLEEAKEKQAEFMTQHLLTGFVSEGPNKFVLSYEQ